MAKRKTQKQKDFDLLLNYNSNVEFTKKVNLKNLDMIRYNKDKISWQLLSNRSLTNEIIEEFWEDLKPYIFIDSNPYNVKLDVLKACKDVLRWYDVISKINPARLTLSFYKELEDVLSEYLIGSLIHRGKNVLNEIPEETLNYVLLETKNQSAIKNLSSLSSISTKLIDKYIDIIDWKLLSFYSNELHDEKNFNKYKNYIDIAEYTSLYNQSIYYTITEQSTIKRLNSVLNEEFLLKYKDQINWKEIVNWINYHSARILVNDKYSSKLNIVSNDFFIKHKDELPMDEISKLIEDFIKDLPGILKYYNKPRQDIIKSYCWKL